MSGQTKGPCKRIMRLRLTNLRGPEMKEYRDPMLRLAPYNNNNSSRHCTQSNLTKVQMRSVRSKGGSKKYLTTTLHTEIVLMYQTLNLPSFTK